ncbi:hypothetical protein [uncultured Mailhella sp.]|uniref:hypothetical protein n=1 Tax=uncultured Mailhella sp. TaxID=1981031 RepID=UPI002603AED5|nr:hypothetical protein [uncultured Mailhella sp.]
MRYVNSENRKLKKAFNASFLQAFLGWLYWGWIVRKYRLKTKNVKTLCVLLPMQEPETSFYAIKLLDKAVRIRELENSIVFTTNANYEKMIRAMCTTLLGVVICSQKSYMRLLQYSVYTGIDSRFINASIEEPHARASGQLLGFKNITCESLVAYGIYGIVDYDTRDSNREEMYEFLQHCHAGMSEGIVDGN